MASASATNLTWDAGSLGTNTGPTVITGSGNWDTSTLNWNNGTADVAWTQTSGTSPTTGAIFGGADGDYLITNVVQVAATNIMINNSGCTFSGSGLSLLNPANSLPGINLAAGKTATITCPIASGNNANYFLAGSGSVLNIENTMTSVQPHFLGAGIVNLSSSISPNVVYVDCGSLNFTSGTWVQGTGGVIYLGYSTAYGGTSSSTGALTVNGGTINDTGNKIVVVRGGGTGTLTLNSGAINVWTGGSGTLSANAIISVPNNDNSADHASVVVNGGVLTLGNPSYAASIEMMPGGSAAASQAFLTQTGGAILSYGGISFGGSSGTFAGGIAALTNSGGSLYLGANGITLGVSHALTNYLTLSGGMVGALANWSSSLPMTLATLNGNLTFQCADNNNNPYNISLSGALTGPGGFYVTGGGTLALSGANNYAGSTVVSNGTLQVSTSPLDTIISGPVTLDGSQGSPTLTLQSSPGQYWSMASFTFQNGTSTLTHNFGALTPSTSVAPIQVSGNVAFQTTPDVIVSGAAIPPGTFPLITYTGTVSGAVPSTVTLSGNPNGTMTGYVTNIVAAKTIALVVTSSPFSPFLDWAVGNGLWDKSTQNWKQNGVPIAYADGDPVLFDDTASGTSPIIVTNNILVNPLSISANNLAKSYTITGRGGITGFGQLMVSGGGTLTLAETNTYSGGTFLNLGQLDINNGGDSSGLDSAIGTGPLTIGGGTAIDNTSSSNVTLVPVIAENWNGNFTYVGSTNSFDTGTGSIEITNGSVTLTVVSNTFEVDGSISDNGDNFGLTKQGNGSLTLTGSSSFGGAFELSAGQLNLGNTYALGSGIFKIDGGAIDNSSGAELSIYPASYSWNASFTYLGTSNSLDLSSGQVVCPNPISLVVDIVSNTLITEGDIVPGNNTIHKAGQGTWDIAGYGTSAQNLSLSVDQGTVLLDKLSGYSIASAAGLLVQSNALAFETGAGGAQFSPGSSVTVSTGGVLDLNGVNETVASFANNNGILRNSAVGGTSTLTVGATAILAATLTGTNCVFDVPDPNGVLNLEGNATGTGSLVKTGAGLLDLEGTNNYAGDTTIDGGSLEFNSEGLATDSTVTISNSASINLDFADSGTNQIGALILNGVSQPPGIYNNTTPGGYITGSGTLLVVPPVTINPLPGPIQFSVSGGTFALSWPTNLGWILQSQTNGLGTGLIANSNAWFDVAGSAAVTTTNMVINPANPTVFFRLRHP